VGGVFLASPDWDLKDVENSGGRFMQHDLDERSDNVRALFVLILRMGGHDLLDLIDQFVANGDGSARLVRETGGIALRGPHCELTWQAKRHQEGLQLFQN